MEKRPDAAHARILNLKYLIVLWAGQFKLTQAVNPPKSAITKFTFHNLVLYLTNYYFPQLSPNTGKQYPENSSLHQKFIDQKLGLVSAK